MPDGTQDPCGYRRNAYPRIICLSPGHAATHIMPNTLASVSVSTESVTVLALRTMVHSGLVAPLGHESSTHAYRRVPMHPVDPPDAWRGDPMRLLALISHCGSRHIHRRPHRDEPLSISISSFPRPTLLSFESLLWREHLEAYTYSTRRCLDAQRGSEA